MLTEYIEHIQGGGQLTHTQALEIAQNERPDELYQAADALRRTFHDERLDLCSIVNAKSGKCTENCKFCAQSSRYQVDVETYEVVPAKTVVAMAVENETAGVKRISLVTAGRQVSGEQLEQFGRIYQRMREKTGLSFCASMGLLTKEKALKLKSFGVERYHCNLETCRSYFPQVCTTHTWEEKVETIQIARDAGLEVCSGGIIGMGESLAQRLELAFELRELTIRSIPINILTPIPGTPFGDIETMSLGEVLTAVAMFRLINPQAVIRLAGGRGLLGDEQYRCFTSGANGAIVGNYLTTSGNKIDDDLSMFQKLGFDLAQP